MQLSYDVNQVQLVLNAIKNYGTPLNLKINIQTYGPFNISFNLYIEQYKHAHIKNLGPNELGSIFGASIIRDDTVEFKTVLINWE